MSTATLIPLKQHKPPVLDAQLLEAVPAAVYVCDLEGVVVRYNRRAAVLWGRSPIPGDANELYCGAHKLYLPSGELMPHNRTPMVDAMRSGVSFQNLDVQMERPDGTRIWVMVSIDPLRDETGAIVGAINCFQDVTEHRLARERQLKIEELNRSIQRQADFIATLAHELRNPLAPVLSGLEILRRRQAGSETESVRAMIERQVTYMARLVDDLTDSARITTGKFELRTGVVDLRDIVQRSVELTRLPIEAANQELSTDLPEVAVEVTADTVRLTQVCANLIGNASKFTPLAGRIRVEVAVEDGKAFLKVIDSGIGIPADKLTSIFEMFAQGERRAVNGQSGLGIGLALAKKLVEAHGGTLAARSEGEGNGSEFICSMPLNCR